MQGITKVYPNGVIANRDVTFAVNWGEIHALSGENGAGKSTLMRILFGQEAATAGEIFIDGRRVRINSPLAAIGLGVGMVHQDFMLVPSLTVTENIVLGIEPRRGIRIDLREAEKRVRLISEKFNLPVDPEAKIENLTIEQKQKVEILKALLRGARILILDEPTAVLAPQETRELFEQLKDLKSEGYTIIFISHKLKEVKDLCDRITVMRRGRVMGLHAMSEVNEQDISRLMVGRDVAQRVGKAPPRRGDVAINILNLRVLAENGKAAVNGVSFVVHGGEILGVAGVEGNGQTQLANALTGMGPYHGGSIEIRGMDIRSRGVRRIRRLGVSHIPEDRMVSGVALRLSVTENVVADKVDTPSFMRFGILKRRTMARYGLEMTRQYGIVCRSPDMSAEGLSGGNLQKMVLARELSSEPAVIVANQPTRGVDVGATEFIHKRLIAMRDMGKAVFLISSDLNEVLGLSDSLVVLYEGEIVAYFRDASTLSEEDLSRFMLGLERQSAAEIAKACHEH